MTAATPLGGLVYSRLRVTGNIASSGDTDSFTIELDAGQTLTALAEPAAGLRPTVVDHWARRRERRAGRRRRRPARTLVLQTVAVAAAGTYTVSVGSAGGTTGAFTLQ